MTTEEQYVQAGSYAATAFGRSKFTLRRLRTDAQHALENEILDDALMNAGIIPPELPLPELVGATTLVGQSSA